MPKKIGQVTLWNYNYGSVLQCFATQRIVTKLGYSCELLVNREEGKRGFIIRAIRHIMSYSAYIKHPFYISKFNKLRASQKAKSSNMLSEINRQHISDFIDKELKIRYSSYKNLKIAAKSEEYTAFLSGSDQVFSASSYAPSKMFFLRFAPDNKKIAWSASFGADRIEKYNIKKFRKYIGDFSYLSARETSGVKIIGELTNRSAACIVDPVLVITPEEWKSIISHRDIAQAETPYILTFFLDTPNEAAVREAKALKAQGKRVLSFGYSYDKLKSIVDAHIDGSPYDFLSYISHADCVFTDSFHAVAFSVQFGTMFKVYRRQYIHSFDQSTRVLDFLSLCDFDRCFSGESNDNNELNFDRAHMLLDKKRHEAIKYLESALNEIEVTNNA